MADLNESPIPSGDDEPSSSGQHAVERQTRKGMLGNCSSGCLIPVIVVIVAIVAIIVAIVAISWIIAGVSSIGGDKHEASYSWNSASLQDPGFITGTISLEVECCEKKDESVWRKLRPGRGISSGWVGSGIVENTTEKDLYELKFRFIFNGKDGLTLPKVSSNEIDLLSGQKRKLEIRLISDAVKINAADIESFATAGVWYEVKD